LNSKNSTNLNSSTNSKKKSFRSAVKSLLKRSGRNTQHNSANTAALTLVSEPPSAKKNYYTGFEGDERYNLPGYTLDDILNNRMMSVDWDTYLTPNELCPESSKHLMEEAFENFKKINGDVTKGYIISVGTERCLFDLLYADENLCEGLIVIDVNPKVKMYMDWIIYCLKNSSNIAKFNENLTKLESSDLYLKCCKDVHNNTLPSKEQILEKEDSLNNGNLWRFNGSINESNVDYWDNDELFAKLKRYAIKADGIRTHYGSVDNLTFLENVNIIYVDTSNVYQYKFLYFLLGEGVNLYNVINMNRQGMCGEYNTMLHPFNKDDNPSFDEVWNFVKTLVDLQKLPELSETDKYKKIDEFLTKSIYYVTDKIQMIDRYISINLNSVFLTKLSLEIFNIFKLFIEERGIDITNLGNGLDLYKQSSNV
jgi:hypothetical protein